MFKDFLFFLLLTLLTNSCFAMEHSYIVINANTGDVLYKSSESKENYPASLTKLMVLYITFDALEKGIIKENQKLTVSYKASIQPPTKLDLKKGDTITVKEAILSLVIKSANDSAVVLSENIGTTEDNFSEIMTLASKQIGLQQTNFKNASGLTDDNQYCTANDMAMLGYALYKHFPQYFHYFSAKEFTYKGKKYITHNNLLNTYQGANGMKTGYTNKSGYNLIASATRNDKSIIAVSLGNKTAKKRDKEVSLLLDYGFKKLGEKNTNYENIDESYKIQLGAFYKEQDAEKITDRFPSFTTIITKTTGEKGTLYKAQLVNLSKEKANAICKRIKELKQDCLVIKD